MYLCKEKLTDRMYFNDTIEEGCEDITSLYSLCFVDEKISCTIEFLKNEIELYIQSRGGYDKLSNREKDLYNSEDFARFR